MHSTIGHLCPTCPTSCTPWLCTTPCETPRSICWLTVIPATLARIIFAYLQSLQVYEQHAWAAGAWRDVFADLVQGQLQQLFLTLLRRIVDASGVHVEARELPLS